MNQSLSPLTFEVVSVEGHARAGTLTTPHGEVPTPAFMPVATQGSVKTLTPEEVKAVGGRILLANAYHLYLRPGVEVVRNLGGIHSFAGLGCPVLTDSGGFQAFSLGALSKVSDEGILFRSHIDGGQHHFTPETATRHQLGLGADIVTCLDQCIAHGESRDAVRRAMERTHRWAARCRQTLHELDTPRRQAIFGIVQGGVFADMRAESAASITSMEFDGYAVGGLAVGEAKEPMYEVTAQMGELLPGKRIRYLMGVGAPEDLVECVYRGMDIFDCALPTRVARNGALFTATGRVDVTARRFSELSSPLEEGCDCYTCRTFSVAYLHHLYKTGELLGPRLGTIHNLRFVLRLMEDMRRAIAEGRFEAFRLEFKDHYKPTSEKARLAQKEAWMVARKIRG